MKSFRFLIISMCFCSIFILAGCFGGDSDKGKTTGGGDSRLNGWYEATIDGSSIIVELTANQVAFLMPQVDSYTGVDGDPGTLKAGMKYAITSSADAGSALSGILTMDYVYQWVRGGSTYHTTAETGSPVLTATTDNWYAYDNCKDPVEIPYEFTDDSLNTLNIYIEGDTDTPPIICSRKTSPAPDAKYAGTWTLNSTEDYDKDSTDENVRMDISFNANGSFSFSKYDIVGAEFQVGAETGTWGIYRSTAGCKYLVMITENSREWNGTAMGENCDTYRYSRKPVAINMFGTTDEIKVTESTTASILAHRVGSDPGLPSLDSSLAGMWQGTEVIGVDSYTTLYTMYTDGTFEKAYLGWDNKMSYGYRGQYISDKGELYFLVEQGWEDNQWVNIPSAGVTYFDMTYSVSSGVLSLGGASPAAFIGDNTLDSIPLPAVSSALAGTWAIVSPTERTEIIISAVGTYAYNKYTMSGGDPVNLTYSESGTCAVATHGGTQYLYTTATRMDETSNPAGDLAEYIDVYKFMRTEYAVDGTTLTLTNLSPDPEAEPMVEVYTKE